MYNFQKSVSLSAESKANAESELLAMMSAQIDTNGTFTINKYIIDKDLYNANSDMIKKDFKDFEETVYEFIKADGKVPVGEILVQGDNAETK